MKPIPESNNATLCFVLKMLTDARESDSERKEESASATMTELCVPVIECMNVCVFIQQPKA